MSKQDAARKKSAPLTAHPLFPAVVALWSAALLGLGSAVAIAALAGKPATLPAIAAAIGAIGAALGYILAKKFLSPAPPIEIFEEAAPRRREQDIIRRPVIASVELGEPILDAEEEDAEEADAAKLASAAEAPQDAEWTEVTEDTASGDEAAEDDLADQPEIAPDATDAEDIEAGADNAAAPQVAEQGSEAEAEAEAEPNLQPVAEMQQRVSDAFALTPDETAEAVAAESVPPQPEPSEAFAEAPEAEPQPEIEPEPEPEPEPEARTGKPKRQPHLSTAPLQELGMVELVERLGLSMRRLRIRKDTPASPPQKLDEPARADAKTKAELGKPTENIAQPPATVSVLRPKPPESPDSEPFDGDDDAILSNGSAAEVALRDALATLRKTRGLA